MAISVIIPCRNAGLHFRQLLESLVLQECAEPWEVIVVDNDSTDGSAALAMSFADCLDLKVVSAAEMPNASYARNVGVRAASGDKLLFIDADDAVAPGYIAALSQALHAHDFVTSRVDSATLNPAWVHMAQGPPWQTERVLTFFDFLPAAGINIGIRRALFAAVGGFPEEFSGSQDVAFCWKAQLLLGTHIHFVPEAVYCYRYRDSLGGLYRQSRNWGFSNALLYAQFRAAGMPGRPVRMAIEEWIRVVRQLLKARTREARAPLVVRLGYCVGRLRGSLRYGVVYL